MFRRGLSLQHSAFYCHWLSTTAVGYRDFYIARMASQWSRDACNVDIDSRTCNRAISRTREHAQVLIKENTFVTWFTFFFRNLFFESTKHDILHTRLQSRISVNPTVTAIEITIDVEIALILRQNLIWSFNLRDFHAYRCIGPSDN